MMFPPLPRALAWESIGVKPPLVALPKQSLFLEALLSRTSEAPLGLPGGQKIRLLPVGVEPTTLA